MVDFLASFFARIDNDAKTTFWNRTTTLLER